MTNLEGKTVLIFAGPDFEDRELIVPYFRFLEAGATVKVAGLGLPQYTGKVGMPITTDGTYADFVNDDFDAIVIPGGWAPDKIRMDASALEIVRKGMQRGTIIGAICHAGWVLTSADVIRDKQVTSYCAIKDDMVHAGGQWTDAEVVVDANLVTSRTPNDLPAFMRTMVELTQTGVRQACAV